MGRGVVKFYESGAALAQDLGVPVSKREETVEAHYQASSKRPRILTDAFTQRIVVGDGLAGEHAANTIWKWWPCGASGRVEFWEGHL